jgi:hypothetical protein
MKSCWLDEMNKRKAYHIGNNFRFDEVDSDLISCFKELRVDLKANVKGICEKVTVIDVNEVINLRPNLKEEIMDEFRFDIEREEVLEYNPINDV